MISRERPLGLRVVGVLIWLGFLVLPMVNAVGTPGTPGHRAFVIGTAFVLTAGYGFIVLSAWICLPRGIRLEPARALALLAMLAAACALTAGDHFGWGFLFCYCAACASLFESDLMAYGLVALSTALAILVPRLAGAGTGTTFGFAASAAGVGLIMSLVRDLRLRNRELSSARSELARLAVAQERERFARDLHDLLGHSLSVIALKAELAGRLSGSRPDRAAAEVADIESVAREALHEVREAVSGYRQPTLDGELEGARIALLAAGIECAVEWDHEAFDPAVESVLAWTVREGATNVIRHSAAAHCTIRVTHDPPGAAVEVLDDGPSGGAAESEGGNGLDGLRERVAAMRGTLAAGPLAGGGFRLSATVPEP